MRRGAIQVLSMGVIQVKRPSWEKAASIMRERYNPETDGRILLGRVDCTEENELCRRWDCSMWTDTTTLCYHLSTKLWGKALVAQAHAILLYLLQQQRCWSRN